MYCWLLNLYHLPILLSASNHVCLTSSETSALGLSIASWNVEQAECISTFPCDPSPFVITAFSTSTKFYSCAHQKLGNHSRQASSSLTPASRVSQTWKFHPRLSLKSVCPSMDPVHLCVVLFLRTVAKPLTWCLSLQLLVCKLAPVGGG